jgi:O-antigen/teichoic acid export membrane protein
MTGTGFARRIRNGTGANVLRQVINIGSELMLVPILLVAWGNQVYGEWQILSAAVAYLTILDFGTHTYAINRLNQCFHTGQMGEFRRNLHSALAVAVAAAGLGLAVVIPGTLLAPVREWFHLTATDAGTATAVLVVLAVHAALSLPIAILGGIYRAIGEYARDIMVNNVYRTVSCALTAVIALTGGGIGLVAVMQLACFAGAMLYITLDLRRRYPEIDIGVRRAEWGLVLTFLVPSLLFFLVQASAAAVVQGTVLVVGATAGAAAVAVFTTLRTLVNGIPQVVGSVSGTLWPELTALDARGEREALRSLHQLSGKVMLWLGIASAVFLHYSAADIVAAWTGGRIAFDQQLIDALLVLELLTTWTLASATLLAASNRPQTLAWSQGLSTAAGLALGYVLAGRWGSPGVAMGLVFSGLCTTAWYLPLAACWSQGESFGRYAKQVLGKGVLVLGGLWLVVGALQPYLGSGLGRAVATWTVTGGIGLVALLGWWLNGKERVMLGGFVPEGVRRLSWLQLNPMRSFGASLRFWRVPR